MKESLMRDAGYWIKMHQDNKLLKIYQMANMLTRFNCAILIKYLFVKSAMLYPASSIQHLTSKLQKKGQAMIFILFVTAVFTILGAGLAAMWESELGNRSSDRDGLIAFYLAQAGIEEAKIWTRNNPGGPFPFNSPWQNFGGGRYNYTATNPGGVNRNIVSVGQALDAAANPIAERQISLQVTNIETPNTDTTNDTQAAWRWREQ